MNILNALRNRGSGNTADAGSTNGSSADQGEMPIPGYDRMDPDAINTELARRSQVDLAAVEAYERSHQDRGVVLDKLRYLRGKEPIEGYDSLEAEDIPPLLEDADLDTLGFVREYELKFRRRKPVLDELARVRHERLLADNPDAQRR